MLIGLLNRMGFIGSDGAKIRYLLEMTKHQCFDYQMIKVVKLIGQNLVGLGILTTFAHPIFLLL